MTSHPLYLTWYPLYLCHHIHCIDDVTPNHFLRSHPLYMTTSYPFYKTSQPLNVCYHTNSFNDITPFVCRTSNSLYVKYHTRHKAPHRHLMISNHYFYDITSTIFDMVSTVSVSSHPLYWWYHPNSIFQISFSIYDDIISIVYDITATECVSSHPPFQRYNTLCM